MKTFKFWARKKDSRSQFVTTEIKAKKRTLAKKWLINNGYEIEK